MIHATEILSHFVAGLRYEDLPPEVVETTKMYIVDYYAACFAGIKVNGKLNRAVEELLFEAGGREEAGVLCFSRKLPAAEAAFLNAVYSHGADMDDGNRKAMGHVGAHVMSAVFALAETLEVTGKDVLTAINAGYEVYNRVAAAVQPGLARRGFHSTGTAGSIASGAAAAKLLGLDEAGIYNAMSLAAVQASGLLNITESGQSCKPINPANAARTGILSAKLAAKGIRGPVGPLEGAKGWFHAMSDQLDESAVTDGLGTIFTICESYLKPYPSCRHTHCGIEAALHIRGELLAEHGCVEERTIEKIEVHIYRNAINIAGQIKEPKTPEDSKFSIHYSLATALLKGHFDLDDLDICNMTGEVRALIEKIDLIEDESMENRAAGIRGAKVVVCQNDGAQYTDVVLIPKGDAANPFTREDMSAKLRSCAEGLLSEQKQQNLIAAVDRFEAMERYRPLRSLLR